MTVSGNDGDSPKSDNWVDFTGNLFSVNTNDWGSVHESICGDQSAVLDDAQNIVDAENQYGHLYNSAQQYNDTRNLSTEQNGNGNNTYLPNAYDCDGSDYGEILVNDDAHDAISTVTPATFAQKEHKIVDLSAYGGSREYTNEAPGTSSDDVKANRRRKFLIAGIVIVALALIAVVVTVPLMITKTNALDTTQVSSAEKGAAANNDEQTTSTVPSEPEDLLSTNDVGDSSVDSEDVGDFVPSPVGAGGDFNESDVENDIDSQYENSSSSNEFYNDQSGDIQMQPTMPYSQSTSSPSADSAGIFESVSNELNPTSAFYDSQSENIADKPSAPNSSSNVSMSSPVTTSNAPAPIPASANSNIGSPTNMNLIVENSPSISVLVEETPMPTYLFSTPAPQLPTLEPTTFTSSVVRISLQTDKQGYETSWSLESIYFDSARSSNSSTLIAAVDENTYSSYQQDSNEFTLPRGTYRFTLKDTFGDGFCCKDFKGHYSITIDGREVIKGGYYRSQITYDFLIGYFPEMTQREKEWLEAHNVRRKQWHERYGVSYVPLKWSAALAKQAESWANALTDDCEVVGIEHEHGVEEGENLAKNQADGRNGMGQLYPPDNILRRWVDYEADLPNPHNLHLTQALWRASKYVGCADALREDEDGSVCRIQVCRYAKPGNCQMGKYNVTEGENWLIPMLADDSKCPPSCPPEGCF